MAFKVGDKVTYHSPPPGYVNKVFTIWDIVGPDLWFVGLEGPWPANQFKLWVEEPPAPHKHAALIKQWADNPSLMFQGRATRGFKKDWSDMKNPCWWDSWEYRIKPEPKPDYVATAYGYDRSVLDKVILTFDGETGKLKDAKVK